MKTKVKLVLTIKTLVALIFCGAVFSGCGSDDDPEIIQNMIEVTDLSPSSPASLKYYQSDDNFRVYITYDYTVADAEGGRIFVQPYTNGSISPGYVYSSSPLFTGTGSKVVSISIIDKDEDMVKVDQLRLAILNPDATEAVWEEFIDVDFTFTD